MPLFVCELVFLLNFQNTKEDSCPGKRYQITIRHTLYQASNQLAATMNDYNYNNKLLHTCVSNEFHPGI